MRPPYPAENQRNPSWVERHAEDIIYRCSRRIMALALVFGAITAAAQIFHKFGG